MFCWLNMDMDIGQNFSGIDDEKSSLILINTNILWNLTLNWMVFEFLEFEVILLNEEVI